MKEYKQFYIDGAWVDPVEPRTLEIENPATEENFAVISIGSKADVDKAVAAARKAFPAFSQTSVEYRAELLEKIAAGIQARMPEMAEAISNEMGAPMWLANAAQVPAGMGHFATTAAILRDYQFEELKGTTLLRKEPIGVCGFITPWNWPPDRLQGCSGNCCRVHHGAQAVRNRAARRDDPDGNHARGRCAEGRIQPRQRRWSGCRFGAVLTP